MPDETKADTTVEQLLDDLLVQYIAGEEAGSAPNRQELLNQHPQFADDLREFFANRDQMQRLAQPLRGDAEVSRGGQPLGKVRYFGDYELLEEVAAGGMGIVYKARQRSLNRIVAVKMILKGTLAREEDVKRFRAEAEAAASLQHPAIVAIHEVGLHEGQHYFSMDYVEGHSLAELPREQPLSARQAAEYVRDAAEAVHYAHQQGTLHRDLKPSNILIDRQGRVRITDFGLAKRIEGNSDLTLTTAQILGTPSYMPPEQALGKRSLIAAASDIYSLGAVLYELLTGRPPFRGESPAETLRQVESLEPISPRLLSPTVPRDLETICLKCLEKEPHKRDGTAQLLADDLGRYLREEPILARPIGRPARVWRWCRRNPVVSSLVVCVVLSLVLGTGVSTRFSIQANQRAAGERRERLRANIREEEAVAARTAANEQRSLAEERAGDLKNANEVLQTQSATLEQQAAELRTRQVSLYRSMLKLAHSQAQGNGIALADENLNKFPEEFRGWAWRYAKRLCHPEFLTLRGSRCVAMDPAGTLLATGVEIWVSVHSLPDGRRSMLLQGHRGRVVGVGFLDSGALTVSASEDGTVRVWNTVSGELVKQLECGSPCQDLTIAPDRQHIAVACGDRKVRIWDYVADRVEHELIHESAQVLSIAYSPDGGLLATGLLKPGLRLWDTATGLEDPRSREGAFSAKLINFLVALEGNVQAGVRDLTFSPDGITLALAQADSLLLLDLQTGQVRTTLSEHFGGVLGAAFSPDGRRIASASSDGNVRIWDLAEQRCIRTLPWHQGAVFAVTFCASRTWLASADENQVKIWDLSSDWEVRRFPIHTDAAYGVAFDSASKLLATGGGRNAGVGRDSDGGVRILDLDGEVRILDLASGQTVFSVQVPESNTATSARTPAVLAVALSADGRHVATAGRSLHIHLYNVATGELEKRFDDAGGQVGSLAFSGNGGMLLAAGSVRGQTVGTKISRRRGAVLFDVTSGEQSHFFPGVEYATLSPDDKTLFGCGNGFLAAWDVESETQVFRTALSPDAWRLAVSPDQRLVALALDTRRLPKDRRQEFVQLRDARDGHLVRTLTSNMKRDYSDQDYFHSVYGVAFTPEGRELASACGDKTVRIWDVTTGDELLVFSLPHQVFQVAFSPNGQHLAAASGHWSGPRPGEVRVWEALP